MAKKLYRTRQEFKYAPTGFFYAVGIVDPLSDWHPDDIKEALRNLIEEVEPAVKEDAPVKKAPPARKSKPKRKKIPAVSSKEQPKVEEPTPAEEPPQDNPRDWSVWGNRPSYQTEDK